MLSLNSFLGEVYLDGNTFQSNQIQYTNCAVASYLQSATQNSASAKIRSVLDPKLTQLRNQISIVNVNHQIVIHNNVFD